MDKRFEKISEIIDKNSARLEGSGTVSAFLDGERVIRKFFGLSDRESGELVDENTKYVLSLEDYLLVSICIFILADMKALSFSDKLSRFIPEYKYSEKITVYDLLAEKSGIRDFFFGELKQIAAAKPEYTALSDEGRRLKDAELALSFHSFEEVLSLIGEKDLEFEPGLRTEESESNAVFLREVVERASGLSLRDFAAKHIFEKLGMNETGFELEGSAPVYALFRNKTYIRIDPKGKNPNFFVSTASDIEKLMLGIFEHRLFSKKMWKAATKFDCSGYGLSFSENNGTISTGMWLSGIQTAAFYFDANQNLCYLVVNNSEPKYEIEGDDYVFFNRELRSTMEEAFTFPKNTKMEPFGRRNCQGASSLKLLPEQLEFVCDAKDTIISYAAHKDEKLFVETEGGRAVGLLLLKINKKKDEYDISIVIIDKRFQGRGFGKIMLRFAVDYLKKAGAKKLGIGVNRFNIPAQRLYKSVGFHEDGIYDEFIYMTQELE